MIRIFRLGALFITLTALFSGCHSSSKNTKPSGVTGPGVIVYKTTDNYFFHVPVTLSQDKKTLVSYPAPSDLMVNGELALPVKLEGGYLLDRRGINENSAFLKWTYYEYSRLDHTPKPEELMRMILDTDPFTEMYRCGKKSEYEDLIPELNEIIKGNKLSGFSRLK